VCARGYWRIAIDAVDFLCVASLHSKCSPCNVAPPPPSSSPACCSGNLEDCIDGFRQRVSRVPADTIDWSHLQAWRCVISFCAAAEHMHNGDSGRAFALLTIIDSFLGVGSSGGEVWCRVYRVISQMLIGQHYRRLNKAHAACEAYCKAAKLCKGSSNSILQLLAPCALCESGAALLGIGRAVEAQVALESSIAQLSELLGRCVLWREVAQGVCRQAGHYWAIDGECWGRLFSEAVSMQTTAAFFNLSLAHAKQSSVKSCCKHMKQCFAVGKLSLPPSHPILHAALRPCEAAQQVTFIAQTSAAQSLVTLVCSGNTGGQLAPMDRKLTAAHVYAPALQAAKRTARGDRRLLGGAQHRAPSRGALRPCRRKKRGL
jgi:hypothetical protein